MNLTLNDIVEDTRAYYSKEYAERILEELFFNAYRTLKSVYIFRNFEEYLIQLKSDKNQDKKEEYWNASYYEKLTDYVKISIAFENFNKAVLIEKGYLVHKLKRSTATKELYKAQNNGEPIKIKELKSVCSFIKERPVTKYYLDGLQRGFPTISYSETLNNNYQSIISLDSELLHKLKEINNLRNRLHFFTDFKGAFEHNSHISKWTFIKETAINTIEEKIKH